MKIFSSLFLSLSAVCMLTACSSKPKTETAGGGLHVVMKTDEPRLAPERMPMSDVTHHIRFGGREYEAHVFRTADETLPVVKNQEGQEFIDNCVRLRVSTGNRIILNRSFTKDDFASLVEDRLLKHSLLEGLVYDTVSTGGLVFAASVSYPQSDLYVPIRLVVTFDGKVSMQRIDQLEDDSSLPAEP